MIDYEKLQQAYKLYPMGQLKVIPIFDDRGNLEAFNYSMEIEKVMADYFFSIDDLIKKLQELTQSKPKYEVGQEVWSLVGSQPMKGFVKEIDKRASVYFIDYCEGGWLCRKEDELYSTRAALIQSQIAYWLRLGNEEISTHCDDVPMKCEHESDGKKHANVYPDDPDSFLWDKCIKCGFYYRGEIYR